MADQVDWVKTLDRMTSILVRAYLAQRAREAKAEGEEKKALQEQFKRDIHFTVRRLADPEFSRFIGETLDYTKRGSKKRGIVVERNMKLLARFILEDIAAKTKKEWATAGRIVPHSTYRPLDLSARAEDPRGGGRSYGRFHELVDEFPELVYTKLEIRKLFQGKKFAEGRRVEDRRERVIGTPFSSSQGLPPEASLWVLAMFRERWLGADLVKFLTQAVYQIEGTGKMRITDLVEVRKLRLFQAYVKGLMSELELLPHLPPGPAHNFVMLVADILYDQTRTLAEMHWFRGLETGRQESLIWREPVPVKAPSAPEVRRCVEEARMWVGFDHGVLLLTEMALEPLILTGQAETAGDFLRACLEHLELSDEDKANCLHHLSVVYRIQGKPRQMREVLLEAVEVWKRLGGHPGDEAVELAYLAELARAEGDQSGYMAFRSRAEELASSDELTATRRAYIALYVADAADVYDDFDWELRVLESGERVAMKEKSLLGHFEYFEQCITDIKWYGKRGPEWGDGRTQRPPEFRREDLSGIFYLFFDDPDFGN